MGFSSDPDTDSTEVAKGYVSNLGYCEFEEVEVGICKEG